MRALILVLALILLPVSRGFAEKKPVVDPSSVSNILDVLGELKGKSVVLRLSNGTSIEGVVSKKLDSGSSHTQLVHLEQITGKEMFSAMILKSSIIGVEYRN
jgi:hypothetical protein